MKKMILCAALFAALVACKKDDKTPEPNFADQIHLAPTTLHPGKASETTLLTMQGDADGFLVWAKYYQDDQWYDGINEINHVYDNGTWSFDPAKQWPTAANSYPIDFFAFYPSAADGLTINTDDPADGYVSADIVVQGSGYVLVDDQTDMLAAWTTANAKPASGNLSMTFHHIFSKINFALDLDENYTANVQGLGVCNLRNEAVFDVTATEWFNTADTYGSSYLYYGGFRALSTGNLQIINTPALTGKASGTTPFYTATTTPTAANAHLMLLPQTDATRTWGDGNDPTALPTGTDTYIMMIYRLADVSGVANPDIAGLRQASSHVDWTGSALQTGGYPATDPLYIKVAYPFELAWAMGKGYTYNIDMRPGFSGGILIDEFYYDKYGNRTDLRVDDQTGTEVLDPITGDGDIHLIPAVNDWDDETESVDR